MCGIAGFSATAGGAGASARVETMTRQLARRGPDAEGLHQWPATVLGHRRLSIFDLSEAGRQPMLTPDGRIGVTFNGAIYNFRDLRRELEREGCRFRSQTDTEVLLHGYEAWGIDRLVARLRGMYAFGIWDEKVQKLFLVRDRLGVKPLYYYHDGTTLAFASTARALHRAGFGGGIDAQAVAEFLEFGYVTDGRAIYQGLAKLPAGSILELASGRAAIRSYWQTPEPVSSGKPSFEEAVEECQRIFLKAVELRLDADVAVGALLSGGIDSSLICWAIAKLGGDITAFTVSTAGDAYDETPDARQTARELKIKHQVIELSGVDAPDLDEFISAYGEPFACSSALGMLRVSRAVKSSATVLLTGDGGDDVFLGYPEHQHLFHAQQISQWVPPVAAQSWYGIRRAIPRYGLLRRGVHLVDYVTGGLGAVIQAHEGLPDYGALLGERIRNVRLPQREMPWSPNAGRRVLSEFLQHDRKTRFVGEYMTKVDGGTMHYALEARAPFLDQELWMFAASLPYEIRLHQGRSKAVLRELARRHIGTRVAQGRKRGFSIPVSNWMVNGWRSRVDEIFAQPLLVEQGWIEQTALRAAWAAACRSQAAPLRLWYLVVLECWLRYEERFTNPSQPSALREGRALPAG